MILPDRRADLRLEFVRKGIAWALEVLDDDTVEAEEALRRFREVNRLIMETHDAMQKAEQELD